MKSSCSSVSFRRSTVCMLFVFVLFAFISFTGIVTAVYAETFMVTSTTDDVSDTGSLRYAIQNGTSQDVITFDLEYPATITLGQQLRIVHGITIQGPGAHLLEVSGNDEFRVFDIACLQEPVTISGISIVRGRGKGGGIYNINPYLTVTNCTFSGNGESNDGGGIYNESSSPTVTNCIFTMNSAPGGGGMYNDHSSPTVTNCTFSDNKGDGGGMYNYRSSPTVTNCTFSSNGGGLAGGGMYNDESHPAVTNCTFSKNSTGEFSLGGGMYNESSNPTVTNCTFSSNFASYGGGMYNTNCSSPTLKNCIFWADWGEIFNANGCVSDLSYCIVENWDVRGPITLSGPIYSSDPKLGPLADNGGQTQTCALMPGSSAIDQGLTIHFLSTDQRGVDRPQCASFDIGAYELKCYALTTTCNSGGCILPESADVFEGANMDFYIYPESDYGISGVYVDGNPVSYDELNCCYTFQSVSSDHVLSADFQPGGDDDDNNGGVGGGGCSISALPAIGLFLLMPLMFLSGRRK